MLIEAEWVGAGYGRSLEVYDLGEVIDLVSAGDAPPSRSAATSSRAGGREMSEEVMHEYTDAKGCASGSSAPAASDAD